MFRCLIPDTGERLAVLALSFAANGVLDVSLRHQIALITAIRKDAALECRAVLHRDGSYAAAQFCDAGLLTQSRSQEHTYASLLEHVAKDLLANLRLIKPGDILGETSHVILTAHSPIKFERVSTDHFLF